MWDILSALLSILLYMLTISIGIAALLIVGAFIIEKSVDFYARYRDRRAKDNWDEIDWDDAYYGTQDCAVGEPKSNTILNDEDVNYFSELPAPKPRKKTPATKKTAKTPTSTKKKKGTK